MHRTPAGLPSGIPGIGEDIDIAMQQAAHPILHLFALSIILAPSHIYQANSIFIIPYHRNNWKLYLPLKHIP